MKYFLLIYISFFLKSMHIHKLYICWPNFFSNYNFRLNMAQYLMKVKCIESVKSTELCKFMLLETLY